MIQVRLISAVIVAPVLAPAAGAQGLDADLLDCLAHTYLVAERADRDAQEFGTDEYIDAARQYGAFSQALSYLLGTADQCQTPLEDLGAEIGAVRETIIARFQAQVADGTSPAEAFAEIQARVFQCYETIGDDAMQAAFTAVQEDGFPCGWGQ